MIGFFIKKAFYDGWDNLLSILLLNIAIIAIVFGAWFLAGATANFMPFSIGIIIIACAFLGIILLTISQVMAKVANYQSFAFSDLKEAFIDSWRHGALFGLFIVGLVFIFSITIPYYFSLGNMLGLSLAITIFWVGLICLLSLQWFCAIRSQLDKNFLKSIKKSFIIFFDNAGFSLFMFVYSIILMALSVVLVFMIPGIAGLLLAQNNALRLRIYKYDWMEEHKDLDAKQVRKQVPWGELIADDEDIVGHRSFKSFIFPWKE